MSTPSERENLARLRRTLESRFNDSELRNLCFDLGITYEDLPGAGKSDKARELVDYCARHDKLADLISRGKELRPGVPWNAITAVSTASLRRNPYWHRGPIGDPAYFYGRTREVRTGLSLLTNLQSISLVGPRRIGKTSLMHYISKSSVLESQGIDPKQFVFVFSDTSCEQLADMSRDKVLQLLLDQARADASKAGFDIDAVGSPSPGMTFWDLSKALKRLNLLGCKLVFVFDEFEYLAQNRNLDSAFFAGLRSFVGNLDVAYVTASGRSLLDLGYADKSILGSPFFNVFSTIRLGLFEDADARDLINRPSGAAGVEFTRETADFILSLVDHHPFYIQVACFHAFELQSEKGVLTDADYPLLRERVEGELRSHLQYAWDHLAEEEKRALVSSEAAWEDPKLDKVMDSLKDQGVIWKRDNRFSLCNLWIEFAKSQIAVPSGQERLEKAMQLPVPEPGPTPDWLPFKLQIAPQKGLKFEARVIETPIMGESKAAGRLPFNADDLVAVLKVLEHGSYDSQVMSAVQTAALERLELLRNSRLVDDWLQRIGEGLYKALFPGDIRPALTATLSQARLGHKSIFLQLRFDEDSADLAQYPWELIHDGRRHLCLRGDIELVRYIAYSEPAMPIAAASPWRLLYITARPKDLSKLPSEGERNAVWNGLQSLIDTGKLTLEQLTTPTYEAFLDRMNSAHYDIIHFDGHGVFARRCTQCRTLNLLELATCRRCQASLDGVQPIGYLAFEDESGNADYVRREDMENALFNKSTRLVFLSACQSSLAGGDSFFGGIGPGLIYAGVPAVVAMQFSMPVEAAITFAQCFYRTLAQGETVARAVAQGRKRTRDDTWYIPTLYLRSQDDEGRLFGT